MEKIKKLIIVLIIILILVLMMIYGAIKIMLLEETEAAREEISDSPEDLIEEIGVVDGYSTFFSVEKMLNKYIEAIQNKENKTVYNLTDETILLENEIVQDNVLEYVSDIIQYNTKYRIMEMYQQRNSEKAIYYIDVILKNDNSQRKEVYFVLYTDGQNLTYSVKKINQEIYEKQKNKWNQEIETKKIERNDDNKYIFIEPTEKERFYKYFEDFLENMLYDPEYAYELLDVNYREICFPTLKDFQDYIEENREVFLSYFPGSLKSFEEFDNMDEYMAYVGRAKKLELEQYQIKKENGYNKYTCTDSEENYYMFFATAPFQYTVMLDNYTIPTEDFIETYNESNDGEKIVLNIKKFFMGIDDKNYGYAYSLLAESFKNNKYPTKNDFITYAEQNFFEKNKIEYVNYKEETGLYIYKITVSDATGKNADTKQFNMIIKLNSGTDFEMSFSEI